MNKQQIFNLNSEEHFFEDDFCISQSNQDVYDYLFKWPSWESNILNIHGPSKSGKTFLLTIFAQKHSFIKISSKDLSKEKIDFLLSQKLLIVEDIDQSTSEEMLFLIFNDFKENNKFLVFSSMQDSSNIKFELKDLVSRFKSVFNLEISSKTYRGKIYFSGTIEDLRSNLEYKNIILKETASEWIIISNE